MTTRTLPPASNVAHYWGLEPETVYLNHGSFGACPKAVLKAQDEHRARLEREAVRWFVTELDGEYDRARVPLARLLNARASDVVFVPNATHGVAAVLWSVCLAGQLGPGDEVLVTSHEYQACMNNLRRLAGVGGFRIVTATLPPFPIGSTWELAQEVTKLISPRTKLAMISHVTSPSGLVLPIEMMLPELQRAGVRVLLDGAHGAGFVPLDMGKLEAAGVTWYTTNCHKWLCAPKGSAVLWTTPSEQWMTRPATLSNFAESGKAGRSRYQTEFDYVGTADPSAYLTVGDAIAEVPRIASEVIGKACGWNEVMERNRRLVLQGRGIVCEALGVKPPAPDEMIGCLASVVLPDHPAEVAERLWKRPSAYGDGLQVELLARHGIQIPVIRSAHAEKPRQRWVRLSAQLYNSLEQYEYLARALVEEIRRERDGAAA
jgi:isopenicillin-N epimerase